METVIFVLLDIHRKGTDTGADDEPLVIILGLTRLERCRRIRLGGHIIERAKSSIRY